MADGVDGGVGVKARWQMKLTREGILLHALSLWAEGFTNWNGGFCDLAEYRANNYVGGKICCYVAKLLEI